MESDQTKAIDPCLEALLLIAEQGGALEAGSEPDSLIYTLLERLGAFLKVSGIGLFSSGAGEVGTIWGRGERAPELRGLAERYWKERKKGREASEVEAESSWTLLPLPGGGMLAICLESDAVLRPGQKGAVLAVAEAALRLAKRSVARRSDRKAALLEAELLSARLFQASLFPTRVPAIPGFRLAGIHRPAGQLSGDFFDLLPIDPRTSGILIGDVAGKGIAAALVGGMCRVAVRSQAACTRSSAGVLRRVNRLLHEDLVERALVAMIYAVVDTETGELRLARAGQEEPLLRRASGVVQVDSPGFCLGIDSGEKFDEALEEALLILEPGELLLFYTDGFTDAVGPHGALFDKGRLAAALGKTGSLDARASVEALGRELDSFRSSQALVDDVTLVALERVGS